MKSNQTNQTAKRQNKAKNRLKQLSIVAVVVDFTMLLLPWLYDLYNAPGSGRLFFIIWSDGKIVALCFKNERMNSPNNNNCCRVFFVYNNLKRFSAKDKNVNVMWFVGCRYRSPAMTIYTGPEKCIGRHTLNSIIYGQYRNDRSPPLSCGFPFGHGAISGGLIKFHSPVVLCIRYQFHFRFGIGSSLSDMDRIRWTCNQSRASPDSGGMNENSLSPRALIAIHFECHNHKSLSAPPRNFPISPIGDGYR